MYRFRKEDPVEDQEKTTRPEDEDVEAHKRRGPEKQASDESQGEGGEEDFELHRRKGAEKL